MRNKNLPKKNKLSDHGSKKASSSNLNAHLYERFINEDTSCRYSGNSCKNTEHFFLSCPRGNNVTYQCNFTVNTNI